MANHKIVECRIGPYPRAMPEGMLDPMPSVNVIFDDGTSMSLFAFYPDEISFAESEFVGLTVKEAMALRHKKDVAHLQG